ncbi:alpha-amylase family protein [Flavicella marina]|uniref:alpha-amylase family protein n=1 Tax=Flavicella marina TaxID=1475951 RepID=UPI001263FDEB|nr:alpha-amylase family protein [Flavicella marina]
MKKIGIVVFGVLMLFACENRSKVQDKKTVEQKKVVYQVFTRLFGNTKTTNKAWGTKEENGVGKFIDFSEKALSEIKKLGVTHIWYTGVLHHAMVTDYTDYGISNDDPDVVKGRAGSPYAVKDYYNVDPDLAVNPEKRMQEFEALIERTHNAGMKVIIDIVPNHIARKYEGKSNPEGVKDFGANDDTTKEYDRNNNFYYVVGEEFKVPKPLHNYKPLGGENHIGVDGEFIENPAKWTGNGSRLAQPNFYDWYETVKINYGVRPDGTKDFSVLPKGYALKEAKEHFEFWKGQEVPDSWNKFKDIALFWLGKGVDGFRYDMAEMVPVEFWSYMNSSIKMKNKDAFLLAEVYNPDLYRDYIHLGKMDYLYDKVALYDSIKKIVQEKGSTDAISMIVDDLKDIEHNMLHFLENHDEQRFASAEFAGSSKKIKPAMIVSATLTSAPTMLYFGQEVGEKAEENAGFGTATRTSIFDYIGVPAHQRWMNNGAFDGGQLSKGEQELRAFYKTLLNFTINSSALMGDFYDLHSYNRMNSEMYNNLHYAFARWSENEQLIIFVNFDKNITNQLVLHLPKDLITTFNLNDGTYTLKDQLGGNAKHKLVVKNGLGFIRIHANGLDGFIFKIQ